MIVLILCGITNVTAQNQPLRIAVPQFISPFVMKGEHQLYGFDITMISQVCTLIKRDCKYQIMPFDELLQSVAENKSDVAIGAITITAERAKIVNFSIPYLLPNTRFLGKSGLIKTPINLELLQKSQIGIIKGSIFIDELRSMGVTNPKTTPYHNQEDMIDALNSGEVDLILVDNGTAMYWQSQSDEALMALGRPVPYGFGIGIAVQPNDPILLQAINQALYQYENSPEYVTSYQTYLSYF